MARICRTEQFRVLRKSYHLTDLEAALREIFVNKLRLDAIDFCQVARHVRSP